MAGRSIVIWILRYDIPFLVIDYDWLRWLCTVGKFIWAKKQISAHSLQISLPPSTQFNFAMQNKAEKNEASITALDAHSDAKDEIYNADDMRLQQMGLSYVSVGSNMPLI